MLQEPYPLISLLYITWSSDDLGQSQAEDTFNIGSVAESAGLFPEKKFLFIQHAKTKFIP